MQAHMRHAARSAPLATHQLRSYAHAAARQRRGHPRRDPLGRFAPAGGSQDTSVCYVLSSGRTERSTSQPSVSSAPIVLGADDKVYTLFEFDTQEPVSVVGTFTQWQKTLPLHKHPNSKKSALAALVTPGAHQFKYVVGDKWQISMSEVVIINDQGSCNNYRVVQPTTTFTYKEAAEQVLVVGDWDGWRYALKLLPQPNGTFAASACIPPGSYSYQFIVDGELKVEEESRAFADPSRGFVHRVRVQPAPLFRLFYATGWASPVIRYRMTTGLSGNGNGNGNGNGKPGAAPPASTPTSDWQTAPLLMAPSRGTPAGGGWKFVDILAPAADAGMEFYICSDDDEPSSSGRGNGNSNGGRKEDRAHGGSHYVLPRPGSFKLVKGVVRPWLKGLEPRMMLVADIDGTMIGEGDDPAKFESSARFARYWEDSAALTGNVLVYNTGRSLGSCCDLVKNCAGKVAVPDVLITAVGTKVWHLDESAGRTLASGVHWVEDTAWARRLDKGWHLPTVRQIVGGLVNSCRDQAQWLDNGSEHPHRCALSCHVSLLEHVRSSLAQSFHAAGLSVRIITSGQGEWRYVDCVPVSAGKQEALEYVRQLFGVSPQMCVSAGDSGNDILMLEGDHPAIVVGNAQPELLGWLGSQPQDGRVILADGNYADGVLEGLARHGLY